MRYCRMVFIGRRWQGGECAISTLTVSSNRARARANVRTIHVVFCAGIFMNTLIGLTKKPCALVVQRLGVELWIFHNEFQV